MNDPDRLAQPPRVIVLASAPLLARLTPLEDLGYEIEPTGAVDGLLRLLRRHVVDAVVLEQEVLTVDVEGLVRMVFRAATTVPVVVLGQGPQPRLQASLLEHGPVWILSTELGAELSPTLAFVIDRASRVRRAEREARELESWTRSTRLNLGELLHELRTPASIIQGFCSNLLDGLEGPLNDAQHHALQRMRAAAGLLVETVGQFRERLPKSPSGPDDVVPDARRRGRRLLRVDELCAEVVDLFGPTAAGQHVELTCRCDPDTPRIWGDRTHLEQVLVNLLSNALRLTPSGGRVVVEAAPARLSSKHGTQPACRVAVTDTGPGVPDALRERIFSRGYSGDPGGGRAGLGLAICRQIALDHRGELHVERALEGGASFGLILPVDPRRRPVSIQIVEDPHLAHELVAELCRSGATPRSAPDADVRSLAARVLEGAAAVLVTAWDDGLPGVLSGSFPTT